MSCSWFVWAYAHMHAWQHRRTASLAAARYGLAVDIDFLVLPSKN